MTNHNAVYALKNVTGADLWLGFDIYFQAQLPPGSGDETGAFGFFNDSTGIAGGDSVFLNYTGGVTEQWWTENSSNGPWGVVALHNWYHVDFRYKPSDFTVSALFINGVDQGVVASGSSIHAITSIGLGATFESGGWETTYEIYIASPKVGTSRGASDVWSSDLSAGLSVFDSTTVGAGQTLEVIDDPTTPVTAGGVYIAPTAGALDVDPGWTQIDNLNGITVATIDIRRGRPDERSQVTVGTAKITGFDSTGALDPTNPSSPFYSGGVTQLDPTRQTEIRLWNPVAATVSVIYRGYSADFTYDLDVTEGFFRWELTMVDALDILDACEMVPDQAGNTVPAESTGDVYYDGTTGVDATQERILALMADAAAFGGGTWPADLLDVFSGNVNQQGTVYAPRTPIREGLDNACDAEFPGVSVRYVSKTGIFTFRGRYARFNPDDVSYGIQKWKVGDIAAWKADSSRAVFATFRFTRGITNLINAALVTPKGIANRDIPGQFVSDATSVSKYAPRSISFENLITADGNPDGNDALQETKAYGHYWVDNYKTPRNRVSQATFRNPPADRAGPVWLLLCGIELSDILRVKTTHPGGGGFNDDDSFVEQLTYKIVPLRGAVWDVTLTVDTSPRAYYDTSPFPT